MKETTPKNKNVSPKASLAIGAVLLVVGWVMNSAIGTLLALVGFIALVSGALRLASKK